ncbi:hypothetical protein AN476_07010 [Phaeobacter sp. 11ANDIMAR09]|nr:hypothetical protein AN476_07010 [Phaeobacter sp. 11ANDIMAR09]
MRAPFLFPAHTLHVFPFTLPLVAAVLAAPIGRRRVKGRASGRAPARSTLEAAAGASHSIRRVSGQTCPETASQQILPCCAGRSPALGPTGARDL